MIKYKLKCENCKLSFDSWFASSQEYEKLKKKNFEYVGENFAYEARSIHYKNKNKNRGIYGTASKEEIKDLREEGIDTVTIPWVEDKNN